METTSPHHADDLRDMRSAVTAVLEDQFGDDEITKRRLDWLDTDEGKNHRHILGLWDGNEDAGYYDELYSRNPDTMQSYIDGISDPTGNHELDKARAAYEYGFDLFDDVVAAMYAEIGAEPSWS